MKNDHVFIPILDIGNNLPFAVKETKSVRENIAEQERAKKELISFISKLEKNFKESLYYMGMDMIAGKGYERFMFEKGGFVEIMIESPLAFNAHFTEKIRAKKFCDALKATLKQILPESASTKVFISSINTQMEHDHSLAIGRK